MKVRLPKEYGVDGYKHLQQIALQTQKIQDDIDRITEELESKEYQTTVRGNAVTVTVTGKLEVKSIEMKPEIIDPEDLEMLSALIISAINKAIRTDQTDKNERIESISGGLIFPGLF